MTDAFKSTIGFPLFHAPAIAGTGGCLLDDFNRTVVGAIDGGPWNWVTDPATSYNHYVGGVDGSRCYATSTNAYVGYGWESDNMRSRVSDFMVSLPFSVSGVFQTENFPDVGAANGRTGASGEAQIEVYADDPTGRYNVDLYTTIIRNGASDFPGGPGSGSKGFYLAVKGEVIVYDYTTLSNVLDTSVIAWANTSDPGDTVPQGGTLPTIWATSESNIAYKVEIGEGTIRIWAWEAGTAMPSDPVASGTFTMHPSISAALAHPMTLDFRLDCAELHSSWLDDLQICNGVSDIVCTTDDFARVGGTWGTGNFGTWSTRYTLMDDRTWWTDGEIAWCQSHATLGPYVFGGYIWTGWPNEFVVSDAPVSHDEWTLEARVWWEKYNPYMDGAWLQFYVLNGLPGSNTEISYFVIGHYRNGVSYLAVDDTVGNDATHGYLLISPELPVQVWYRAKWSFKKGGPMKGKIWVDGAAEPDWMVVGDGQSGGGNNAITDTAHLWLVCEPGDVALASINGPEPPPGAAYQIDWITICVKNPYRDDFDRTVVSGWGTGPLGAWTFDTGSGSVDGAYGQTPGGQPYLPVQTWSGDTAQFAIKVRGWTPTASASGQGIYLSLQRAKGPITGHFFETGVAGIVCGFVNDASASHLEANFWVDGNQTAAGSKYVYMPPSWVIGGATTDLILMTEFTSTDVKAKWWIDGHDEPDWQLTLSHTLGAAIKDYYPVIQFGTPNGSPGYWSVDWVSFGPPSEAAGGLVDEGWGAEFVAVAGGKFVLSAQPARGSLTVTSAVDGTYYVSNHDYEIDSPPDGKHYKFMAGVTPPTQVVATYLTIAPTDHYSRETVRIVDPVVTRRSLPGIKAL